MDSTALKAREAGLSSGKEYVRAFAQAVARFAETRNTEGILAQIPSIVVSEFDAARSELWVWDQGCACARLSHAAGRDASHRTEVVAPRAGIIGKVAHSRKPLRNLSLAQQGGEDVDFSKRSGLTHVSVFPLVAQGNLAALVANYSVGEVPEELLTCWEMYSEMACVAAQDALTAQENQKAITQLSLLFEATKLLNSTLDLAELLENIVKMARTELKADRGSVFLVDRDRQQLWSIVASGIGQQEIRLRYGQGVAGTVAETGEAINVDDAYTLPFFDRSFDQKFGYRTKSLLCLPIRRSDGQIVGVIQLLNQTTIGRFTREDEDFLNKLSGHIAVALENARLHRESLEKQRLEREMALARQIQRSLLPSAPPAVAGYELSVLNEPCFEVGGDYYDFLSLGPQTLLLVIADVEGKGVSSAMVMSNLQASLRALVMHLHSLEVVTLSLNDMIYNDTKSEKYLSLFLGLVDTKRGGLHYINAGHVPPLLVRGASGEYQRLEEGGTVIGLFPNVEYTRGSTQLQPGDILILCTDGIGEACNAEEDEYGMDRLAQCVARHRQESAQKIVDAILDDVNTFAVGGVHVDDKVLMVLKVDEEGHISAASSSSSD